MQCNGKNSVVFRRDDRISEELTEKHRVRDSETRFGGENFWGTRSSWCPIRECRTRVSDALHSEAPRDRDFEYLANPLVSLRGLKSFHPSRNAYHYMNAVSNAWMMSPCFRPVTPPCIRCQTLEIDPAISFPIPPVQTDHGARHHPVCQQKRG